MNRVLLPLMLIAAVAGCAAPATEDNPDTDPDTTPGATSTPTAGTKPTSTTTQSTQPPPTPTPTVITPTTLPTPPSPPPATGFILRTGTTSDGVFAFFDEAGAPNPTLRVPPSTTITIDFQRSGQVHALSVGSETLAPAGSNDVRVTFESPSGGAFEYGCPVHPHQMRGTVQVQG